MLDRAVRLLRDPAHTGANRCWPCTVLNATVAAVASVTLGGIGLRWGVAIAVAITLGSLALALAQIALRGYLVPGTPAIAARLPDRIAWLFHR